MKIGNYNLCLDEMVDMENENGLHWCLVKNGAVVVEIYDGIDADEDGLCSDTWVKVDGEKVNHTYDFINEFRKEVKDYYY